VVAAIFGLILGAPTLRLRGDYLAIVTLAFGEIVPQAIRNLESITNGTTRKSWRADARDVGGRSRI
jgi:branched-chain amino acid transport system permease protein